MMNTQNKLWIIYLLSLWITSCLGDITHIKYKRHDTPDRVIPRRYMAEINTNFDRFLKDMETEDIKIHRTIQHKFFNSVTFEILDNNDHVTTLKSILNHANVESVSPVHIHKRDLSSTNPNSKNFIRKSSEEVGYRSLHQSMQIDKVHRELNLTGEGIFIAIIDGGVDYNLPALGGGYGPGFKIQTGYDFIGKDFGGTDESVPEPDDDPYDDCYDYDALDGHGTSVAGIIGGYDSVNNFTGVAPNAKLGFYRIFSCYGETQTDLVYQAMLKAHDDGADIISLSIGASLPWSQSESYSSKIVSNLKEAGVTVVSSAGNDGEFGIYSLTSPGTMGSVFSVGSAYNEYFSYDGNFTATGIANTFDYQTLSIANNGTKAYMVDGKLALSFNGTGPVEYDACEPENVSPNVKGKIALTKRGDCTLITKAKNVKDAGGIGLIVYDDDVVFSNSNPVLGSEIPFALISLSDGLQLKQVVQNATVSIKFSNYPDISYKKFSHGGGASYYTSIGPTVELDFKPNVLAVGEDVLTLVPHMPGAWSLFDGASAAVPIVSGSIALYLEYIKKKPTNAVDTIFEKFQNYALASISEDSMGIDNPIRIGSGLIQVYDSITQTTQTSPCQISFNDTASEDYKTQNITIMNNGPNPVSYRVYNNASIAIAPYDRTVSKYDLLELAKNTIASASLAFSETKIHIGAGQNQTISVTVTPPNTDPLDHIMYGGFIQFDPIIDTKTTTNITTTTTTTTTTTIKSLHVPYFGSVGKQYDLPILDPNFNITIEQTRGESKYPVDKYLIDFSANRSDLIVEFRSVTPTKLFRQEIFSFKNCTEKIGYAGYDKIYNKQDEPGVSYSYPFKGTYLKHIPTDPFDSVSSNRTSPIPLPDGEYYLRLKFLKVFGDMKKVHDWEYIKVGPITIKRNEINV